MKLRITFTFIYAYICPMASRAASYAFSLSPHHKDFSKFFTRSKPPSSVITSSIANSGPSFSALIFEAVRQLGPPARFEASKLKVELLGDDIKKYSAIIPRTYILSHCDFTANLTLTISNVINLEQLRGWYSKDDVVAEWKRPEGQLGLHIHCYVSGPNLILDLAAAVRYHIFSKEMPLVLEAILHGDSLLFTENQELMDAPVWVYFHSSSPRYNRLEYWGPLRVAAKGRKGDQVQAFLRANREGSSNPSRKRGGPKSIFQTLFAFLL